MIPVTKPYLPLLGEYYSYLEKIWDNQWITNNGPLVIEFEEKVAAYLQENKMIFTGNGTIALQLAIKALGLKGEVITTPFSYVATTSSLVWQGCTPVFADINRKTFNIDPVCIEKKITSKTTAILATHVFGNPCEIEKIEDLARTYNLKVVYDAAHCFGVKYKNESIFSFGDISIASFHATKIFHTIEGGGVFSKNEHVLEKIRTMRNFGHSGPYSFEGVGINGKNSEVHAAMGLTLLPKIELILSKREKQYLTYLKHLNVSKLGLQNIDNKDVEYNYAYLPIIFDNEETLIKVVALLENQEIYPRRYFYPSLTELPYVKSELLPNVERIARTVLCLPLFHDLEESQIIRISEIVNSVIY